ncbi:VOC family protein [Rhodovibrionaceae bacterium A322]
MKYYHTMIRVSDLDASLKFFCDVLDFEVVHRVDNEKGRFTLAFLAASGDAEAARENRVPTLELTHNWDPEDMGGGRNFGHLAYRVENIYDVCEKIQKAGITINRPPRDGFMAFIRTPDNISIEFLQEGEALPPQEPWASMENTGEW